jgi:XRE family transcriptional regulator, regulator of sulfur utilization
MTIGEIIKKLRKERKLSQIELADECKISRTYISEIESGKRNPTVDILERIGEGLHIPFPIISYLTLDINSLPEIHQKTFHEIEAAAKAMIDYYMKNELHKEARTYSDK